MSCPPAPPSEARRVAPHLRAASGSYPLHATLSAARRRRWAVRRCGEIGAAPEGLGCMPLRLQDLSELLFAHGRKRTHPGDGSAPALGTLGAVARHKHRPKPPSGQLWAVLAALPPRRLDRQARPANGGHGSATKGPCRFAPLRCAWGAPVGAETLGENAQFPA